MTRLLPFVLSPDDLPAEELQAARLDGEVFAVDSCFAPVDLPEFTALRAESLRRILPSRLIAERRSAAWVYGAIDTAPRRHDACADISARYRTVDSRIRLREVVIEPDEISVHSGLQLTSILRTTIDLIRCEQHFDDELARIVARLASIGGIDRAALKDYLDARRHLPHKTIALARIEQAFGSSGRSD